MPSGSGNSAVDALVGNAKNGSGTPGVDPGLFSAYATTGAGGGPLYANAGVGEVTIPLWRNPSAAVLAKRRPKNPDEIVMHGGPAKAPDLYTQADASTQFGQILADKDKLEQWRKTALESGLLAPEQANDAILLQKAWDTAVGWAINIKSATKGQQELTPFEAAKMVAENTGSGLLAAQTYAANHFTGDRTEQRTSVKDSSSSAYFQLGSQLQQLLGRNPTAAEQAAYQHGLDAAAAAHPVVTSTTTHYQDGKATGADSTVSGGVDRSSVMQSLAAADPEVAKNQQATTYYDALVNALGAAV